MEPDGKAVYVSWKKTFRYAFTSQPYQWTDYIFDSAFLTSCASSVYKYPFLHLIVRSADFDCLPAFISILPQLGVRAFHLTCGGSSLPSSCIESLCQAIVNCPSLHCLDLSDNGLTDDTFAALATALGDRRSAVSTLCLFKNAIGDAGAMALATAVKQNSSICFVDLRMNHIGDKGLKPLLDVIEHAMRLEHMLLDGNYFNRQRVVLEKINKLLAAKPSW
eukprot:TRINITY_DN5692_c0_g1_i1.p1 TRINITY_DN5692_c0_g1~~TRINITY_DN5692_c0_g1_i1.p1  ORF type:complete len:220 (+),score=30.25 TRINITY_DN5692_c0_g1_i1:37-696(+)